MPGRHRTLAIGVWFDYAAKIGPDEGLGVFLANLLTALRRLGEPLTLTIVTRPGDHDTVAHLVKGEAGTIRILPEPGTWPTVSWRTGPGFVWAWLALADRLQRSTAGMRAQIDRSRRRIVSSLKPPVRSVFEAAYRRRAWALMLLALGIPIALAIAGGAVVLRALVRACVEIIGWPIRLVDGGMRWLSRREGMMDTKSCQALVDAAQCEVWLVPHPVLAVPLPRPAVLFIHDLVACRFPELFPPAYVEASRTLVPQRAAEAALCVAMSETIRQLDLVERLQLPASKVRLVPTACPQQFAEADVKALEAAFPHLAQATFVFFPAKFRGHKNHVLLVDALARVDGRAEVPRLELVFTGEEPDGLPVALERLARRLGVRHRIHVTGRVTAGVLAALYQRAWATVVPSLYEQGSFPLFEAVHYGSPIACADIPALREQCRGLGDACLYFDPHNADALVEALRQLALDRRRIVAAQGARARHAWRRTWDDVAKETLALLREAAGWVDAAPSRAA